MRHRREEGPVRAALAFDREDAGFEVATGGDDAIGMRIEGEQVDRLRMQQLGGDESIVLTIPDAHDIAGDRQVPALLAVGNGVNRSAMDDASDTVSPWI